MSYRDDISALNDAIRWHEAKAKEATRQWKWETEHVEGLRRASAHHARKREQLDRRLGEHVQKEVYGPEFMQVHRRIGALYDGHDQLAKHWAKVARVFERDARKADEARLNHEAHLKLLRAKRREYDRAAATIQRAYKRSSASPYTQLGRRRILRNGGFDPDRHRNIVVGRR